MNKTYTFDPDSINIKNSFTWENSSESWENLSASKNFGKWTLISNEYPPLPSEGELIEKLLPHMEDRGMFKDIVSWLWKDAPKKLRRVLNELDTLRGFGGPLVTYFSLCRVVYELGFRANEFVENRMIFGPGNDWAKMYFAEFPPGSRN